MSERELLQYWPSQQDVVACITSEAEAASEWVSMAVHQPMRLMPRVVGAAAAASPMGECDEQDLLRAFLTNDLPEGRVIIPIVGQSGVGKSHVVRWLDTQLRARADVDHRVVIRIPKGVSLREVLRILLEALPADRYGHYRDELERAQHELDSREASGLLCEMLAHVLEEMGRSARERRVLRPDDAEAKEREAYCAVLPTLLRNQYLREHHFLTTRSGTDGPVRRLVEHLTTPRGPGSDDDRKHGFVPEDLDFGDLATDEALGRLEREAINRLREDRRKDAVRVLNLAIDDAKQRLLRIGPSTISDLFDSIRRDLLVDGKELVLLVEDFVVLSGLQKQLLQVIIKEAVRDGKQVLCRMRTALAYTTGYLDADTVLTRAHIEYRIPDESPSDEEILLRIERLVGAYLNAARLGQGALERAYRTRGQNADPRAWIPHFAVKLESEARATLDAFGATEDGYELFPLNRSALHQLAREGCLRNGAFVYNPRFVIQNVLNAVLTHRALFEAKSFPPPSFGLRSTQVGASVTDQVRRVVSEAELDRHLRFLAYWAGGAGTGRLPPRVVEAFNLSIAAVPGARGEGAPRPASAPPPPARSVGTPQTPVARSAVDSHVSESELRWDGVLEDWRRGAPLGQRDANELRRLVFDAARDAIEWDWFLHRPKLWRERWAEKQREWLYLPRAAGGEGRTSKDAVAVICADEDLQSEAASARVKLALMALVRLSAKGRDSRTYPGVETDAAAGGALVERVAAALREHIERTYFGIEWDAAPLLVEGLLVGARALAVEGADRDDPATLSQAIFAAVPSEPTLAAVPGSGWAEYVGALARCRGDDGAGLSAWTTHLLNLVGARQGGAEKVHAIDAGRLKPLLEELCTHWSHRTSIPRGVVAGAADLEAIRGAHAELRRLTGAIEVERDTLVARRGRCVDWMGAEFDKNELLREMKEAFEAAHASNLARAINTRAFNATLDAFRSAPVKAAFDDVARLSHGDRGVTLTVLSRRHSSAIAAAEELVAAYDVFETAVVEEMENAKMTRGVDPFTEAVAALQAELVKTEESLEGLDGDDQ